MNSNNDIPIPAFETLFHVLQIQAIATHHAQPNLEQCLWKAKWRVKVPFYLRQQGIYPIFQYTVDLALPDFQIGIIIDRRKQAQYEKFYGDWAIADPEPLSRFQNIHPTMHPALATRRRSNNAHRNHTRKPDENFVNPADFMKFKLLYELGWTVYYVNQHHPLLLSPGGCAEILASMEAKYPMTRKFKKEFPDVSIPDSTVRPTLVKQLEELKLSNSQFILSSDTLDADDEYNPDDDPEYIGMLEAMKTQSAAPTKPSLNKQDEALHFGRLPG